MSIFPSNHVPQDRRRELGLGFMSLNLDFWTDPHRKEQYLCMVYDLLAEQYDMADGSSLFMSRETESKLDESNFLRTTPTLANLEYPGNFQRCQFSKTIANVTEIMRETNEQLSVEDADLNQVTADGGSNAVGSAQEFELVGREKGRENSQDFIVCVAHQNERAGGYASGTAKFAEDPNPELGKTLTKNHSLQERFHRNSGRMGEYNSVQTAKGRNPLIGPYPGVCTRWGCKFLCCCALLLAARSLTSTAFLPNDEIISLGQRGGAYQHHHV